MAGNVYTNLKTLGCSVDLVCGHASKKTRLIDVRSKQQILRIDEDVESIPVVNIGTDGYDAVVVSDYNKGVVSYELIELIIRQSNGGSFPPVFIDTKKTQLDRMQGAWVKINELEYSKVKSECTGLIVTKGGGGAYATYYNYQSRAPKVEVADVTGAGDTFLAALTYNYLHTRNIMRAMDFANLAAAVTVQHIGCYAPTNEEILWPG